MFATIMGFIKAIARVEVRATCITESKSHVTITWTAEVPRALCYQYPTRWKGEVLLHYFVHEECAEFLHIPIKQQLMKLKGKYFMIMKKSVP